MGGGSRKSYASLYKGGVAHCICLTEGGWSFWPPNIEILRNVFIVPNIIWDLNVYSNRRDIRGSLWYYWHPLGVLDTGRNKEICLRQGEESRLNWQKKRESRSAVSKHGDRGGSGLSYGRKQSFNQAINDCILMQSDTLYREQVGKWQFWLEGKLMMV